MDKQSPIIRPMFVCVLININPKNSDNETTIDVIMPRSVGILISIKCDLFFLS